MQTSQNCCYKSNQGVTDLLIKYLNNTEFFTPQARLKILLIPIILALFLALLGCTPKLPLFPLTIDATNPNATHQKTISRFDTIEFRSFVNGMNHEIKGLRCTVTTPDGAVSVEFNPPAKLRFPIFRGQTTIIYGKCTSASTDQFRTAKFQIKPENLSSPKNEGITLSLGKYGTSVSGVFSIRDRAQDQFKYPTHIQILAR